MKHVTYSCDWCKAESAGPHWLEVYALPSSSQQRNAEAVRGIATDLCPACATHAGRVLESAKLARGEGKT